MDLDEEGMRAAFISGQAASYFGGSWDLPFLLANVKDFELGVFKFPQFADEPGSPVAYGGVEVGLCLSSTSPNPDLAKAYIEYATRPEIAQIALEPLDPIATSHTAVVGSDDPIATQIREEYLPTSMFLDWVWPRELTETIQREIQAMMAGSKTPQEAAEAIQAKYDQMVADGYTFES
jgi:raffinose/stachyose/melibiose transport system substrate-binding protein